jgi:hypothetical protein
MKIRRKADLKSGIFKEEFSSKMLSLKDSPGTSGS